MFSTIKALSKYRVRAPDEYNMVAMDGGLFSFPNQHEFATEVFAQYAKQNTQVALVPYLPANKPRILFFDIDGTGDFPESFITTQIDTTIRKIFPYMKQNEILTSNYAENTFYERVIDYNENQNKDGHFHIKYPQIKVLSGVAKYVKKGLNKFFKDDIIDMKATGLRIVGFNKFDKNAKKFIPTTRYLPPPSQELNLERIKQCWLLGAAELPIAIGLHSAPPMNCRAKGLALRESSPVINICESIAQSSNHNNNNNQQQVDIEDGDEDYDEAEDEDVDHDNDENHAPEEKQQELPNGCEPIIKNQYPLIHHYFQNADIDMKKIDKIVPKKKCTTFRSKSNECGIKGGVHSKSNIYFQYYKASGNLVQKCFSKHCSGAAKHLVTIKPSTVHEFGNTDIDFSQEFKALCPNISFNKKRNKKKGGQFIEKMLNYYGSIRIYS
eukprot:419203_1